MRIITTHLNADFDGLASMIGAQKLYPDGLLVFPGSQEKIVRDFISQTLLYRYEFQKLKNIDLEEVDSMIVVDTRDPERLGVLAECLDNPGLSLHLYDHHPSTTKAMKGSFEIVRDVGSTATIFTELFQEKKIDISPEEATIIALGIYQDTGSLTHSTTTADDLRAAAWLLEQGANIEVISQFISHDLTSHQVALLHDLMKAATTYTIAHIPIVVATMILPRYIDDFAIIVQRFMNMENLDTLFVLVSMAGRIYLIGRSRIAEVNAGHIARDLGGGGHATAASATIRDTTMVEAQEKLIFTLHRHVRPQAIAEEMMSSPAISIPTHTTIHQAHDILTRYNVTAIPVLEKRSDTHSPGQMPLITGTISRRVVEKAIHHHLGHLPVSDYMTTDIEVLSLKATLADIQELIIEHRQRLIPIVHDRKLRGIITRTDLLNRLVNDPAHFPKDLLHEAEHPSLERTRNLGSLLADMLDKQISDLLKSIGEVAEDLQFKAFVVGGFVRDLMMKKSNLDLDIVIEGDGIVFAKKFAALIGGRVKTHERFITAVVLLPDGFKIDVATARLEYYDYPAALPTIELSSIKLDLYRRDFTINAMAIQLNPAQFGNLLDFFNCQNDLKHKAIRVLHNLSFVEDPTRIFRAIRFEKRMNFTIVTHTKRLIRNAVNMKLFDKGDDPRFFTELTSIFSEENPLPAIYRLEELGLFQFLWPDLKPHLKIDRRFSHILNQAEKAVSWFKMLFLDEECLTWQVYLLAIMGRSTTKELHSFCNRFQLPEKTTIHLQKQKELADHAAQLLYRLKTIKNSFINKLFQQLSNEGLLYLAAIARKTEIRKVVSLYVTKLKHVTTKINGNDLRNMGYKEGPKFKEMLTQLKNARLDGLVSTRQDEEDFIKQHFKR